jgi:hypothetical protein
VILDLFGRAVVVTLNGQTASHPRSVALKYLLLSLALLASWLNSPAVAAESDATVIMTRVYEARRVDDQIARLTFTFSEPDGEQQRVVYTMVWKNMQGKDGYDSKAMYFTEVPAARRGVAYLGWLVPAGSAERDDEWIYLPQLRTTRRIAHRDRDHASDDDEFGKSLLTREQLDPRPPGLDEHRLVSEETLDDRPHYVIASTPKRHGDEAARVVRWIDKVTYNIDRARYYDDEGRETLDVRFVWEQRDDYWIWKSVTATDPVTQAKTELAIDIKSINSGLRDRDFTRRILERGSTRFQ